MPARTPARLWLYRALALVAIPSALFLGLEGALRAGGFGRSVGFLIPDERPGYLRTNPEFVSWFIPSNFDLRPLNFRVLARKPPNTVRIVVLGESAAQGIPVPAFAFAAQLRAQLRARYPDKEFEVINTGIVAINSHVVYQVARELSALSPDLFVVYMGNNEVVGPYGPGCAYLSEMPPLWVIRLSVFVRSTRTGQLLTSLIGRFSGSIPAPQEWGGMSMFVNNAVRGDDPRLEAVYRNFEANLRDIVRVASGSGAKTLLCTVASNIKDCAPLLSLHRAGITDSELEEWGRAFNRGRVEWRLGDLAASRGNLLEALRLDPQYADTAYMLGSLELQAGDVEAARRHFVDAAHWDALRFRPDPRINEIVRRVARDNVGGSGLLDAAILMGSDPVSTATPAGRELFFEHVHFDWDGNYLLARKMAESSEEALFGSKKGDPSWLDSQGCAAALGYTRHERLPMLQRIGTIVRNPPFTNQLTYCEDQARLARDLAVAQADRMDPGKLRTAKQGVGASIARDPENPDLPKIAEEIDDDLDDVAGALDQARRAQELQPRNFALSTDEAIKLSRLGRFDEAERLLRHTASSCPPRDLAMMDPAFADFFTRTGRFEEGRRYLDGEIARAPADDSLRFLRGRLARFAGDKAAAERECRAILVKAPGSEKALEELAELLGGEGRTADIERETLTAADRQPRNLANNLRAAIIWESRGDSTRAVGYLLAAEKSGPVTSGIEVRLAKMLFAREQLGDALEHLALAMRISCFEGDPSMTESIIQAIGRVKPQWH